MEQRRILVIAGSDSSGGAGLEADQRVLARHGCYAMTATTAITIQNTEGVYGIHKLPAAFVSQQIDAVCTDVGVDFVKIGMLASADTVVGVAASLIRHGSPRMVLDPVMLSTSGAQLLPDDAVQHLITDLVPISSLVTPNVPEALLLASRAGDPPADAQNIHDLVELARRVQQTGAPLVLLKGGHLPLDSAGQVSLDKSAQAFVVNVLHDASATLLIVSPFVRSDNTHGTGCSLASAIASRMTLNPPVTFSASDAKVMENIARACWYIQAAIQGNKYTRLGRGHGPIDHFVDVAAPPNGSFVVKYDENITELSRLQSIIQF